MLAGDYNINLLKINEKEGFAEFLDMMTNNSLIPTITLPTRFSSYSCSLLDNIYHFQTKKSTESKSGIIFTDISDHLPCFTSIKFQTRTENRPPKFVKQEINSDSAMANLLEDLASKDIFNKLNHNLENDPNYNYDIIAKNVQDCKEKHFPTKLVKFNKRRHKNNQWMTYNILNSINNRDRIYRELKSVDPNSADYTRLKQNLSVINNIIKKDIRREKKNYFTRTFEKYKNDIKNTWKTISGLMSKSKSAKVPIENIIVNDKHVTNKVQIANEFNNFFVNIGPELASKIDTSNKRSYSSYMSRVIDSRFYFSPVGNEQTQKVINSLTSKSSSGHDGISTKFLKSIAPVLIQSLTLVINQSLLSGIFPDSLKVAKVIPLHKKDCITLMDNYRPVSLLTSISKVIEKVVHIQLSNYLKEKKLLYISQYGFRGDHSTELASLELIDRIHIDLDSKKCPIAVFMDLSKAFDTLDHDILLYKLSRYGVKDKELSWFRSYLTGRKQFVDINGTQSELLETKTGVPQGSILGPLLFLIYMNDIPNCSKIFKFILYADDTSLLNSIQLSMSIECKLAVENINSELSKISDWLSVNKLSLNVKKTKYMVFHHRNKKIPAVINLRINSIAIERVANFNFLGLMVNENLSWKSHINLISTKLSKSIGVLNKLKHILPKNVLRMLYCSLILPYLNYSLLAWGFDLVRLNKLQKRAIRTITCSKYNAHTEPIFRKLNLLKLEDIFTLNLLKFYFKFMNQTLPGYFKTSFCLTNQRDNHSHNTRSNTLIPANLTNTMFAQSCLRSILPKIINNTDDIILNKIYTHSPNGFKNYVKNHMIRKYSTMCTVTNCYICAHNNEPP